VAITLPLAFTIGLLSSLHCLSMCGPIACTLTMTLPQADRDQWSRLAPLALLYNLGRVLSYGIAGAVVAGVGGHLIVLLPGEVGHVVLRVAAAGLMIGIGLHLAGLLPGFARIDRLGRPLWRRLERLGRRLVPVRSLPQAALVGMVWGWLPCGLVYAMLLTSAAQGSATAGALFMVAFGLGTMPSLLAAVVFTGRVTHLRPSSAMRRMGGLLVVSLALATLVLPGLGAFDHRHGIPGEGQAEVNAGDAAAARRPATVTGTPARIPAAAQLSGPPREPVGPART
jgi:sulfite exporter TauE/SafE